jgi:hypothetical protein
MVQLLKRVNLLFFTTDLIVDQFAFKKDTIGITIHVDNKAILTPTTPAFHGAGQVRRL